MGPESEPLLTELRDIFPPVRPVGLRALNEEGTIILLWHPNDEPDLAGYNVWRSDGASKLRLLELPVVPEAAFQDVSVSSGRLYTYSVTAVDGATPPNESEQSDPVNITVVEPLAID